MTPIREMSEQRGRDAVVMTPIPTAKPSTTEPAKVEKGRGGVPMVEVKPDPKPATTPEKRNSS